MKRILQVISSLKKNGTETFVMNLFRNIDRNEFMFDFLTFSDEKDGFYEEIISLGGKVYALPPRKASFIGYHKALDKFFAEHAVDYNTIHAHGMSHSSIAPLYYAKKHGIPQRISHIHGIGCCGMHNRLFHRANKYRLNRIATHFLSCSIPASEWGFGSTPYFSKSEVIINGINLPLFAFSESSRREMREKLGIGEHDPVIIHVGSFNPIKNQKFLVDILGELSNTDKNLKIIFAGEGSTIEEVKEYSQTKGLSEKTLFLGRRDDTPALLSAADIMVLPSLHEGLPFATLEAQASGLPVVVSKGVPEEVKCSDNFLRLPLESGAAKWSREILGSLKRKGSRLDLDCRIARFSIENTVDRLAEIYSSNIH